MGKFNAKHFRHSDECCAHETYLHKCGKEAFFYLITHDLSASFSKRYGIWRDRRSSPKFGEHAAKVKAIVEAEAVFSEMAGNVPLAKLYGSSREASF